MGGHRYYLHVAVVDVLNHPDAVHLGHFDIHHHQRRMLVVEHGERLGYMQTGKDLPAVAYQLLQHLLKQTELQRVVIEQQYLVVFEMGLDWGERLLLFCLFCCRSGT